MRNFKIKNISIIFIGLLLITTACNKTKQHSKWLTGETWKVSSISIDAQPFDLLPTLTFDDCDIYDEICFGSLKTEGEGTASFAWQIRNKGTEFELSDQTQNVDESNEEAVSFSSSFSAVYTINESTKKEMEIESSTCLRYPGKKVIIRLSKQ
jgi:hypothetical protein